MDAAISLDPALHRFRDVLAAAYGQALDRVVLFGSRARGDAGAGSDYNVAVFLNEMPSRWAEIRRIAAIGRPFLDEGIVIEAMPFRAADYERRIPIMHEIRKDGVAL